MAKCNLFKPLSTAGGTFYTFSQWSEDLTVQNALGDAYRIVPSRFAAFNIDYSTKTNDTVAGTWQNKYEHMCAAMRQNEDTSIQFTPKDSSWLFWQCLAEFTSDLDSSMMFVGDMDVVGTNYIDGATYSEMYCCIPTDAKRMTSWERASSIASTGQYTLTSAPTYPFGWESSFPAGAVNSPSAPQTVGLTTTPFVPEILTMSEPQTTYSSLNSLDSLHRQYMSSLSASSSNNVLFSTTADTSFKVNTIVLFYDIVAKDENNDYKYLYTAVPMGVYFTGHINGSTLENELTKYVTNDDIYGQGTSYGLRVTTKFAAVSAVGGDVHIDSSAAVENNYPELAIIADRFSEATDVLRDVETQRRSFMTNITNHLTEFKDTKTNIPYIREIEGVPYWFVNGRSTGVKVYPDMQNAISAGLTQYLQNTNQDIESMVTDKFNALANSSLSTAISSLANNNYISYIDISSFKNTQNKASVSQIDQFQVFPSMYENDADSLFSGYSSLTRIPKVDTSNATSLNNTFSNCSALKSVNIDSAECTSFSQTFNGCTNLKSVHIDGFSATSASSFNGTFDGCTSLKDLYIDGIHANGQIIDLSTTQVSQESLMWTIERMVPNLWSQEEEGESWPSDGTPYVDSLYDNSTFEHTITFKVPSTIGTYVNRAMQDCIYNAMMNKHIDVIIQ